MRVFAIAVFFGAFLLFSLQPMMGKFILPWFGGGTAVWSSCMLFFQVVLLFGYAYAHCSSRWLRPRTQVLVHLALICAALAFLPVTPSTRFQPSPSDSPTLSILVLLTVTAGLPYFVLSATGPLMQQWFSLSRPGVSPYPLFALSNTGSLVALASYSFLLEPLFTRKTQAYLWSSSMGIFALFAAACGWMLWRARAASPESAVSASEEDVPPSLGTKLFWLALSATASALMLAITNKLCLDLIVMPFLWTLPLALYLLSFIWSFAGAYKRRWNGALLVPLLLIIAWILTVSRPELMIEIPVFAAVLFYCCLACHGELYRSRPAPRHLTTFYLLIATGGALGGVFVAVIAPLIFNDYFELPWLLAIIPVLMTVVHWREGSKLTWDGRPVLLWPVAAVASLVLAMVFWIQSQSSRKEQVVAVRNFYGVLKLQRMEPGVPHEALGLFCGTTLHGFQLVKPGLEGVPAGYYHERTGIGLLRKAIFTAQNCRMGVVGLGAGTLATYGRSNDVIRFYEINPMDVQLAKERFSFLSRSPAHTEIILGDARLSMERERPQQYDLLVLDAFNSDAIPVHLLTREAFQLYDRHLKPDGAMAVHISSKYLNLVPVVENLARELKLNHALIEWDPLVEVNKWNPLKGSQPGSQILPWEAMGSRWMLLSRNSELLNRPEIREKDFHLPAETRRVRTWTDEYNSLLPHVRWE